MYALADLALIQIVVMQYVIETVLVSLGQHMKSIVNFHFNTMAHGMIRAQMQMQIIFGAQ
jgi:hypothetical protein